MSRTVTAREIEQEYGVPAKTIRYAVQRHQIKNQIIDGSISIALQDAEPVIYDYHARQDSYTWQEAAKKFHASPANQYLRRMLDAILPHYCLESGTYYPISDVEDVLADLEYYHIRKYKDKYYYLEDGREDFYITNYFTIAGFRQAFRQKYGMEAKLCNFSKIKSQLGKSYPVEAVNLFGFSEYMIPSEYMEQLMEDYHRYYTVKETENPYDRYEREIENLGSGNGMLDGTLKLFNTFSKCQLENTKNQMQKVKTLAALWKYLLSTLDQEIYLYKNEEICRLMKSASIGQREYAELCLFLKSVADRQEDCAFDIRLSLKREVKVKTEEDFYTEGEWEGYVNFIFDIDAHIEKAFENPLYAKYWLYCLLQCSLAWRVEDILSMPALQMQGIEKYTLEWFEQNEFTISMAWKVINMAKNFIEQERVGKTGAKRHFIILNSFAVATAIGFLICEKHRRKAGDTCLFGKFWLNYKVMAKQLGSEIKGFSNLKAVRTILSFANETASYTEHSGQAVKIASYMRSHMADRNGFSDMTVTYLKGSFDERELLSLPAKMGELGLFGWLYHEILTVMDEKTKTEPHREELIGGIREEITPARLEGYAGYLLQEQKKRSEIIAEIMGYEEDSLRELCAGLKSGKNQGKKEDIYCIRPSCPYPTSQDCGLCGYAVPSIHALHVIGQEASGMLDRLIGGQGTDRDKERYAFQLFKLLTILKEAKEEFGEEFVSSFADYKMIGRKLEELQDQKKGVEEWEQ